MEDDKARIIRRIEEIILDNEQDKVERIVKLFLPVYNYEQLVDDIIYLCKNYAEEEDFIKRELGI